MNCDLADACRGVLCDLADACRGVLPLISRELEELYLQSVRVHAVAGLVEFQSFSDCCTVDPRV